MTTHHQAEGPIPSMMEQAIEASRTRSAEQLAALENSPAAADEHFDVAIVGCGSSGLYAALNLPEHLSVLIVAKGDEETCGSMLAQGGICVLRDEDDYDSFYEDTMRAGHYENRAESVDIMIRSSRAVIDDLVARGVDFARTPEGELAYTREGGHSKPRICFHEDTTGKEITTKLLACVRKLDNVTIRTHTACVDLLEEAGQAAGIVTLAEDGSVTRVHAPFVILATGGVGGLFDRSTNFPLLTADGIRMAADHGAQLESVDYVQIHPTSLYSTKPGRAFLISESCRGEGAILIDAEGRRFTDELQPRDVVTAAVRKKMAEEGSDHVRLSFENIPAEEVLAHFPGIYQRCLEEGYDITKEPIPVVPAQHYYMGGIHVDSDSQTTLPHLFAVGETSCNGVHGANRLASNSLLEGLVFAQRAARKITCIKEA